MGQMSIKGRGKRSLGDGVLALKAEPAGSRTTGIDMDGMACSAGYLVV